MSQTVGPVTKASQATQEAPEIGKGVATELKIISDNVETDDVRRVTAFTGNVEMHHADFHIKCDLLLIYINDENDKSGHPFKQAIATGARVLVERTLNKGVKEVGESRKAVFEPKTGDIVLSEGPPRLQSGKALITTTSPRAIIKLRKDGSYRVINDGSFRIGLGVSSKVKAPSSKQGEYKNVRRYFRPIQPTAIQAHMLANKQAKQEFGEKPFRVEGFKKKTKNGSIVFTATVPFESNDLKAEVIFYADSPAEVKLSHLTSDLSVGEIKMPTGEELKSLNRIFEFKSK